MNGLVIYFAGQHGDTSNLKIIINENVVYNNKIVYGKIKDSPWRMKIETNIRDTVGYYFNIKYFNESKSFFLPAKGIESVLISYGGFYNVDLISKTESSKDSVFAIYLTKNIIDNCSVKIASDSDTIYHGLFINNYPPIDYNTMRFIPQLQNKGIRNFYVKIWNFDIYFDCNPEKYSSARVNLDCSFNIFTNLDEEWESLWWID
jgi:hypothetical protein